MKSKINYSDCFNIYFSIPKSIKGDDCGVKEIKIYKNRLYSPKSEKITLSDMNKFSTFKKQKSLVETKSISNKDNADEINTQRIVSINTYKYTIYTNPDNLICFPNSLEYHTNDKDLKQLIDLMNEPMTKEYGYSNVVNDKTCKVYKRMVEGYPVILIKCIANIPFNKDTVFEAIANLEIRKQWDSVFSELKVVNYEGENGAEILYMIVKSPVFIVTDREFVQQRKMWKNFPTEKSHILHFISVENPSCPYNKKYVRAETIISGYYMQDDPENPDNSILGVLSQTDLKGNIPHFLVNKFAPKASKGWVKSLLKGCKIVMDNHNYVQ
jgi:hypothetical protein